MSGHDKKFDVVILGTDLQGSEREEAAKRLAGLLKIAPYKAEGLLNQGEVPVVIREVSHEQARQYHQALTSLGIKCTFRPSIVSSRKLELVPIVHEDESIVCPACGHRHKLALDIAKPEICTKCGVVFNKYDKVEQIKEEREKIKRRLLQQHQRSLDEADEAQKLKEAEERRQRLEEEIRKELGLPRFVTNRKMLIGSVGLLFTIGTALGAGTAYFLPPLLGYAPAGGPSAQSQVKALLSLPEGANLGEMDPAALAHLQASALLNRPAGFMDKLATGGDATAAGAPLEAPLLDEMLAGLRADAEWDWFLSSRADALVDKGAAKAAVELAEYPRDPRLRFRYGAALAQRLAQRGETGSADKLFTRLANRAETLPDGEMARVRALCEVARYQTKPDTTLAAGQLISDNIVAPAEKAVTAAELGAARMSLGQFDKARAGFANANRYIAEVNDPYARALAVTRTASAYAGAGSRGGAFSLLEDVGGGGVGNLTQEWQRDAVLKEVVQAYGELGDVAAGLQAASRMVSATAKNKAVYGLIVTAANHGHIAEAMQAVNSVEIPAYQARAHGLLGLLQGGQPAYKGLMAGSFQQAHEVAGTLTNPAERLAVLGELARFAAHAGAVDMATQYFTEAEQLAESTRNTPDHDRAMAVLAANEARAQRFAEADKVLAEVGDAPLAQSTHKDLGEVKTAVDIAAR
ncbi:hypothetical protein [Methylomagnum sp.]